MTDLSQKKQDERRNEFNQNVAAAVTGAVVGAGVAIAGAVVLNDKKNRNKVKKVLTDVKDQAIGYIEDMQKQVQDKKDEIEEKFTEGEKKVKNVENSVKKSLRHTVKDAKKAAKTK